MSVSTNIEDSTRSSCAITASMSSWLATARAMSSPVIIVRSSTARMFAGSVMATRTVRSSMKATGTAE